MNVRSQKDFSQHWAGVSTLFGSKTLVVGHWSPYSHRSATRGRLGQHIAPCQGCAWVRGPWLPNPHQPLPRAQDTILQHTIVFRAVGVGGGLFKVLPSNPHWGLWLSAP